MCNEIAHFTLTLIKLFVYAVENELYTGGGCLHKFATLLRESTTACNSCANHTFPRSQASAVKWANRNYETKQLRGCLHVKTRTGASFIPTWLFDFVSRLHDDGVISPLV